MSQLTVPHGLVGPGFAFKHQTVRFQHHQGMKHTWRQINPKAITARLQHALVEHLTVSSATFGVSSLGLNTTLLPASNAGTIWPLGKDRKSVV